VKANKNALMGMEISLEFDALGIQGIQIELYKSRAKSRYVLQYRALNEDNGTLQGTHKLYDCS
jgi:hypothetical protein